ncbi:MAG: O-antigen polysaccharide polymerase Wzy [Cyanobacteria bacterium P01_A01_bin.84]
MNESLQNNQSLKLLPNPEDSSRKQLLVLFWLFALFLFIFELFWAKTDSLLSNFGAVLITITSLFPSYLWCSGKVMGMPILPLSALSFTGTCALPLVTNNHQISSYSPESQFFASLTIAGFLALSTFVWYISVKSIPPLPKSYRVLNHRKGDILFLSVLALGNLFLIANTGGWFSTEGGIFTAIRATILGLVAIASFVLSYRFGSQDLPNKYSWLFICLLIGFIVNNTVSFLLVGATTIFLISIVGFIFGSKKVPILLIITVVLCISFLHYGKGEMRSKYWFSSDEIIYFQPWEYPQLYTEWVGHSWDYLNKEDRGYIPESDEKESFLERSSIIQMLMLAQEKSPKSIPYLYGKTYSILPELLVPRVFNSNKITSHEGTILLNLHYKNQPDREAASITTIGWGLLAESYANFGLLGCAGLGIISGFVYGKVTRWSINAPILSVQSLIAVIFMTFAFQSEWSAGVYVTALFQSIFVICAIALVLMKTYRVNSFTII